MKKKFKIEGQKITAQKFAEWLGKNHFRLYNEELSGKCFWESPSEGGGYTEDLFELFLEDSLDFKYPVEALKEKLNKSFDDLLKRKRPWWKKLFGIY